jgi:hypothetical protein
MTMKTALGLVVGAILALWVGSASAQEPAGLAAFNSPAVTDTELSGIAGGASPVTIAMTNQSLSALNSGNTINADSLTTGGVNIDAGAFSGFNGVGNFVFNTGNNNNLQGSLSITIITPGAP